MSRAIHELPHWLEPVLAFVNTIDVETGTDELGAGPEALTGWLTERGLLAGGQASSRADYRLAVDLRSGLRSLALRNNGGTVDADVTARLGIVLGRLPLAVSMGPAGLAPHRLPPVRAALATVVSGYARGVATGEWSRIRRCPADDCAWVFWDSSAKGARRWCTMRVCGNRAKVRAFALRAARKRG